MEKHEQLSDYHCQVKLRSLDQLEIDGFQVGSAGDRGAPPQDMGPHHGEAHAPPFRNLCRMRTSGILPCEAIRTAHQSFFFACLRCAHTNGAPLAVYSNLRRLSCG